MTYSTPSSDKPAGLICSATSDSTAKAWLPNRSSGRLASSSPAGCLKPGRGWAAPGCRGQSRNGAADARDQAGGGGARSAIDGGSGLASGGGTHDGRQERRGGGSGSAQRRSAGDGEPADVRPKQVCRAHQDEGDRKSVV